MDLERGAGLLHLLTSYTPDGDWDVPVDDPRVRHDLVPNDPATRPPWAKQYDAGLPVTPLPRELPNPGVSATAVLAGSPVPSRQLDAAQLGRILYLGAGVVRTGERPGYQILFRAAGSAGGRFPLEVYASTRGVQGVPDGVHWYDPIEHALVQVGPAAGGAASTLIITGIPWRTGWRYAERGWRHLYWDAGTALSQLIAAADSAGVRPQLLTRFADTAIARLVGADGVHEFPLALLALGDGPPATEAGGPATKGHLPEVEFPLCTQAQRAGDSDEAGPAWPVGPVLADIGESPVLDEVILRRGSQRLMDRNARLPRQLLDWPMRAAMRGIDVPHWVVVHAVEGTAPGIYRWPDLDTPQRQAELRDELLRIGLDQYLAADAGYVVIGAIDGTELDDRGYRDAQLAAGLVEGRLHLAAYALRATASGMTFTDSEVPDLLGQSSDLVTLLFTCVGVGRYASRPGGMPGEPVRIRQVTPKFND
jgi:SagB-type dehydrogenase family enzyme